MPARPGRPRSRTWPVPGSGRSAACLLSLADRRALSFPTVAPKPAITPIFRLENNSQIGHKRISRALAPEVGVIASLKTGLFHRPVWVKIALQVTIGRVEQRQPGSMAGQVVDLVGKQHLLEGHIV